MLARPQREDQGDLASSIAFKLGAFLKMKPFDVATALAANFSGPARAEAAKPGFVNFYLSPDILRENLPAVGEKDWLRFDTGGGQRVNIEFVSANPTGPLHVGHGRGAVIGDVAARLLETSGRLVTREYYLNDTGRQIELLGESLLNAARLSAGMSDGGWEREYAGAYIDDLAGEYRSVGNPCDEKPNPQVLEAASLFARKRLFENILSDLLHLGVRFDAVQSERELLPEIPALIECLRAKELLYEAEEPEGAEERVRRADSKAARHSGDMEGGTFLRTSRFGDEIDRIILRKGGAPTYFTSDILYHLRKFDRGFQRVIDVWGADHGGHVKRLRAALSALRAPAERFEVILCQMVRLSRDGREVKMSKRSGEMITLSELIDEVGSDAVRFFFLLRSPDSQFDFDLDLAVRKSSENPVYYCQYAHARSCQLRAKGREHGLAPSASRLDLLSDETELDLLRTLLHIPETIRLAAERLDVHRLPEAAMRLAAAFHRYQTTGKNEEKLRVVRENDREISEARLFLVERTGAAMKSILELMGVSAPEKM